MKEKLETFTKSRSTRQLITIEITEATPIFQGFTIHMHVGSE